MKRWRCMVDGESIGEMFSRDHAAPTPEDLDWVKRFLTALSDIREGNPVTPITEILRQRERKDKYGNGSRFRIG